jgi:hypothetical protein
MGHGFMFGPAMSEMVADHRSTAAARGHAPFNLKRFETGGLVVKR